MRSLRTGSTSARIQDWLAYRACQLAVPLAGAVPPERAYPLLDAIGDLVWVLNRPARRAVEANLAQVIGHRGPDWRHTVRRTFRNGARYYYTTLRALSLGPDDVRGLVRVRGWEHVDAALAAGRGVIIVTPHSTGVGMGGQAFAARGLVTNVAVEPIEPPELLDLLSRARAGVGVRPVPLGPRAAAELLAALRRNEVVALVADRELTGSGVAIPFFGRPTLLPAGPALLALRAGAPILPSICVDRGDGHFVGVIEPPLRITRSGNSRRDVERLTRAAAGRLEYHIGKRPEHWMVFQPIWNQCAKS